MRNQRRQSSYHRLYAFVLVAVALLALMITLAGKPQPASAQAISGGISQITNSGLRNGIDLSLSSEGARIAFATIVPTITNRFPLTVMTPPTCNPSFAAAANFQIGSRPFSVVVGDFNGDSRQDLATANNDSNSASILLGDGA